MLNATASRPKTEILKAALFGLGITSLVNGVLLSHAGPGWDWLNWAFMQPVLLPAAMTFGGLFYMLTWGAETEPSGDLQERAGRTRELPRTRELDQAA